MDARLPARTLVSGLIRAIEAKGGSAMLLARGDAMGGALLVVVVRQGRVLEIRERAMGPDGRHGWIAVGPAQPDEPGVLTEYVARRRRVDPDLWVVELDLDPDALDPLLAML